MNVLGVVDIVFLTTILLCAGDALRQLKPWHQPVRSVAFALVAIGALGWIHYDFRGVPVRWWALSLHAGFAIYAVLLFLGRKPLGLRHVDSAGRFVRRPA